ncbi:MAG: hypothetical protein QXZ70_07335 [Candidatus Bathyarchaeia archaeon]
MSLGNNNGFEKIKWSKYLDPKYDLAVNFRNIFKCMYTEKEIKDRQERRNLNPYRLDYGLTLQEISKILEMNGINHSADELSIELDTLIDYGIAVPMFTKKNGVWTRVYRFAESVYSLDQYKYIIAYCMERLCSEYSKSKICPHMTSGIPRMLFEKAFVVIKEILEHSLGIVPLDLELKKQFDRYGARLEVKVKGRTYPFTDWCEGNSLIKRESAEYYTPGEFFETNNKIQNSNSQKIFVDLDMLVDTILHIYETVEDWKHDYRTLLSITTCDNCVDFFEAMKAEFALWSDHPRTNFNLALNALSRLAADLSSTEQADNAAKQLGRVDGYFAMGKVKEEVRTNIVNYIWKMDYICCDTKFEYPYKKFFQGMVDVNSIKTLELPTKRILYLNKIARRLTSVCRTFLWENKLAELSISKKLTKLSELVEHCNALIEEAERSASLQFKSSLSNSIYGSESMQDRLKILIKDAKNIYSELQSNYTAFLESIEPKLEEIKEPRTVFSYDWRHSTNLTDKEIRKKLAWKAFQILKRFTDLVGDGDLGPTFDDSNQVVFRDIKNSIECAMNFIDEMKKNDIFVRSSLICNSRFGPSWSKLEKEIKSNKYSGPLFEIAARAQSYLKEEEKTGESYIFMSEDVAKVFIKIKEDKIGQNLEKLENVNLGLPGLLPVNLYVYRHVC